MTGALRTRSVAIAPGSEESLKVVAAHLAVGVEIAGAEELDRHRRRGAACKRAARDAGELEALREHGVSFDSDRHWSRRDRVMAKRPSMADSGERPPSDGSIRHFGETWIADL